MSGDKISDMTDSLTVFPDGAFVPMIVTTNTSGLVTTANYRYNAGLYLAKLSTLAAATGAALIGSTGPSTVQADITARPTSATLAAPGGSALIGFDPGGTSPVVTTVQAALRWSPINLAEKGFATGGTSVANAAAFAAAVTDLSGGGAILINPGAYACDTVNLTADLVIQGSGREATILTQGTTASSYGLFYAESSGASAYIDNITIRDLTLKNTAGTFSEFIHLMAFAGVRNLIIERVNFVGFRGDGLCLHSRAISNLTERHNINVTVRDCIFDGVNNENRNGISVIDCDGLTVENCRFVNCTKSTMPGPFDVEPDQTYGIARNIRVDKCSFKDCGGNLGSVAMFLTSTIVAVPTGLSITRNSFRDAADSGPDIFVDVSRVLTATDVDMAVTIDGNEGSGGYIPFDLRSCKGARITETNAWQDYARPSQIGLNNATDKVLDVRCEATLIRCGTDAVADNAGIFIGAADGVELGGYLYRCGPAAANGYPIRMIASVTTTGIHLLPSLRIVLNTSQVNSIEASSHTQTPATNRISLEANFGGGVVEMQATAPGQRLPPATETFDPGSLATGASTAIETITVTGAVVGDNVDLSFSNSLAGAVLSGWVSAADTVSYFFTNTNGTNPLDLASGTVTVTVTKKGV